MSFVNVISFAGGFVSLARLADSAKSAVVARKTITTMMIRVFFRLIPFVLFLNAAEDSEALMGSHKKKVQFRFNFPRKNWKCSQAAVFSTLLRKRGTRWHLVPRNFIVSGRVLR